MTQTRSRKANERAASSRTRSGKTTAPLAAPFRNRSRKPATLPPKSSPRKITDSSASLTSAAVGRSTVTRDLASVPSASLLKPASISEPTTSTGATTIIISSVIVDSSDSVSTAAVHPHTSALLDTPAVMGSPTGNTVDFLEMPSSLADTLETADVAPSSVLAETATSRELTPQTNTTRIKHIGTESRSIQVVITKPNSSDELITIHDEPNILLPRSIKQVLTLRQHILENMNSILENLAIHI